MLEKSKNHEENEKKSGQWKSREKSASICVEQGNIQGKTYVFAASLGHLIPLHHHEEACERLYLSQIL